MQKFITYIILCVLIFISCNEHHKDKGSNHVALGSYNRHCLIEAVADDKKADTSIKKKLSGDSIVFTKQEIGNCCGHEKDSIVLADVNDTVRLVNVLENNSGERVMCDCNCLFELRLSISKALYDTMKMPIYFGRHKLN